MGSPLAVGPLLVGSAGVLLADRDVNILAASARARDVIADASMGVDHRATVAIMARYGVVTLGAACYGRVTAWLGWRRLLRLAIGPSRRPRFATIRAARIAANAEVVIPAQLAFGYFWHTHILPPNRK